MRSSLFVAMGFGCAVLAGCSRDTGFLESSVRPPDAGSASSIKSATGTTQVSYTYRVLAAKGDRSVPSGDSLRILLRAVIAGAAAEAAVNKQFIKSGHHNWQMSPHTLGGNASLRHVVRADGHVPYSTIQEIAGGVVVRDVRYKWTHEGGAYHMESFTSTISDGNKPVLRIVATFGAPRALTNSTAGPQDIRFGTAFRLVPGKPLRMMDACDSGEDPECVDGCDPFDYDCTVDYSNYDASAYNDDVSIEVDDTESALADLEAETADVEADVDDGASVDSCGAQRTAVTLALYTVWADATAWTAASFAPAPLNLVVAMSAGGKYFLDLYKLNAAKADLDACKAAWARSHPDLKPVGAPLVPLGRRDG